MKTTVPGNILTTWEKALRCPNCGWQGTADQGDVRMRTEAGDRPYEGNTDVFYVACETRHCGHEWKSTRDVGDLPEIVKQAARARASNTGDPRDR